MHHLKANNH